MEERFFVEDTVCLKQEPSIVAVVEQTWRDINTLGFTRPDDWIPHSGIPKKLFRECIREGRPPKNHVVVRFLDPYAGCTLVKEGSLTLKDRGLVVGDVVKKSPQDIESGYVIKGSMQCTLQPIYTDLPWSRSQPWPYKAEENQVRIPAEELSFVDYNPGDFVMYKGWVGEVSDYREEVTIRLEDGSVVRVKDSEELEVPSFQLESSTKSYKRSLTKYLREARSALLDPENTQHRGPADFFFNGQRVFTKKGNLRLGHWVIGSYNPSIPPRGIVVDVRVVEMALEWLTCDVFDMSRSRVEMPPETLTTDELDEVKLYNRNNVSTNSNIASDRYGSRQGHDIGAGDYVKFRDNAAAAVKYSESSPRSHDTGVFRRIPRQATLGWDLNSFIVRDTSTLVSIQWQNGTVTETPSIQLIPYLQVDDNDLWIGELCSLKSEETKDDGTIRLGKIGVVQSVDARERLATIRWFQGSRVAIFEEQMSVLVPGSEMGTLSDESSQVSVYEVIAYPALTKRRGDLVIVAPNEQMHALHHAEAINQAGGGFMGDIRRVIAGWQTTVESSIANAGPRLPDANLRWFGEVVDLGLDGMLTVRLGGLDKVEDVRVPVTRVSVVVGGDDDDVASTGASFYDDEFDSDDSDESDVPIEEIITYEGGIRLDDGGNSDDWTDDDDDDDDDDAEDMQSDEDDEESKKDRTSSISSEDIDMDDAPAETPARKPELKRHAEIDFASFDGIPERFQILEDEPPLDHYYFEETTVMSANLLRRVRKEHAILSDSLPPGIWVRTWDDRLDILRILIIGPRGTPYELSPFVIDLHFNSMFPNSPPEAYFHSWTYGVGRINPNLYEDGKVCLSVLGTWPEGEKHEGWNKDKSSVLQVLVSLMGLVLVEQPYYNEAGFEALMGTEETLLPSRIYTEKAYCMAKGFIAHAVSEKVFGLEDIIRWLYLDDRGPGLLRTAVKESQARMALGKSGGSGDDDRLSAGAEMLLKKHLSVLEKKLAEVEEL